MARIPTFEELGNVRYDVARPEVRYRGVETPDAGAKFGALARGAESAGNTVAKVALAYKDKQDEDAKYEVQKQLIDFDLDQEKRLDDAKRNAGEAATGFTDQYRKQYDDTARAFMQNVPEHLRPEVDTALVRRGAGFEKRAYDYELKERDRYHVEDVNRKLTDLYNDSTAAPDRWDGNAHRGVALIRASRLPTNVKLKTEREFLERNDEYAARARLEAKAAAGEDLSDEIAALRKTPRSSWLQQRPGATESAIEFIKGKEGDKDNGWDYRQYSGPYGVKRTKDERLTPEQAEQRLGQEVEQVQSEIRAKIKTPLSDQQLTSLTSLFYNIGTGKGRLDQVAKLIDSGQADRVPDWIQQYTRNADGGKMDGLVSRRADEAALFADGLKDPTATTATGGEPAEKLQDERDEPVVDESAQYRYLTPTTRRKLLNNARTAQRGVMSQVVEGQIARVRKGEEIERDDKGRSAFDRAVEHLTPFQKSEATAKMETAKMYAEAVRGIQDKTSDQAADAIQPLGVTDGVPDNLVASQQKAFNDALTVYKRLETMRQKDPAAAVIGDPKSKIMPAKELLDAKATLQSLDKRDPQYQQRVWETMFQARVEAQKRTMPDREPRLLTKSEAQNLIPLPAGTKFTDPIFRTVMAKAADVAQQRYGAAYAKKALEDAVRWTITGDDEKRQSAGIIAKMAVGEPVTMQDLRRQQLMQQSEELGVMPRQGWAGSYRTAPDDRDAEGQAGGFYGTAPVKREPPAKRENAFKQYAPTGASR